MRTEELRTFHDWTSQRNLLSIGTNAGSDDLPFQNWRNFKEAFAPELIERAVLESVIPVKRIADPFGGSGTTALAAQFLGIKPTTIEVNPFLADLIEAKITDYDCDLIVRDFSRVMTKASKKQLQSSDPFPGAPPTFLEPGIGGRFIFSRKVARRLSAFKSAIKEVRNPDVRRLFKVLLASAAVSASNVLISGKGRRYRANWIERQPHPDTVDECFEQGVLNALFDLRHFEHRPCRQYEILRGDARTLVKTMPRVDLCVFSPPYPNSFDYTDVYNVELWALGYLSRPSMNRTLRELTLRSHVQIKRDFSSGRSFSSTLSNTSSNLDQQRDDLWDMHIPEMIGAYFEDMRVILRSLKRRIRPNGRIYMIVGDSRYANIRVPVATILAEEAPHLGYRVCSVEPFRSMRASPQQGGRQNLDESLVVLQNG